MSDIDDKIQLNAEMAAISAVKSEELVSLAKDASDLQKFQNKLTEAKNSVETVKTILTNTQPYEVSVSLVNTLDNVLDKEGVDIPPADGMDSFQGAECLGITLMPNQYLFSRLLGCENFLSDFFRKSKEVTFRLANSFKEGYILFTESQDSLESGIDLLSQTIHSVPDFDKGTIKIVLGSRLFNLFKVHSEVNEKWEENLSKLSRSISGLANNYYLNSNNVLNATLSYFGGFEGVTQEEGLERLMMLPVSIPSKRFKECNVPNRRYSTLGVTAKQSVELMGGAFFLDSRQDADKRVASSIGEVEDYLDRYTRLDYTIFDNSADIVFPNGSGEVDSLSSAEIIGMVKLFKTVMEDWKKIFNTADRFKLADADFAEVTRGIYQSQMDDDLKSKVAECFSAVVRKNQMELLNIRTSVNAYLVLIINGLIELAYSSIKANPTDFKE